MKATTSIIILLFFVSPFLAMDTNDFFEKKVQDGKKTVVKDGVKETKKYLLLFTKIHTSFVTKRTLVVGSKDTLKHCSYVLLVKKLGRLYLCML